MPCHGRVFHSQAWTRVRSPPENRAVANDGKPPGSLAKGVIDLLAGLLHGTFGIDRVLHLFNGLVHLRRTLFLTRSEAGDEREEAEGNQSG